MAGRIGIAMQPVLRRCVRSLAKGQRVLTSPVHPSRSVPVLGARAASSLFSPDNIVSSPYENVDIPECTFAQYIFKNIEPYGDDVAMVDGPSGRSYTYKQLMGLAMRVAGSLNGLGYVKGDILAIHSVNVPEYPILFLGCSLAGVIISPVNPAYTPGEVLMQLQRTRARGVVTVGPLAPVVQQALSSDHQVQDQVKDLFVLGEAEGFQPVQALMGNPGQHPVPDVKIDPLQDVLALPFSSGTTGLPKGVMLTHHNCVSNLLQIKKTLRVLPGHDRSLAVLPFYHIYGLIPVLFGSIQDGARVVTLPKFDPQEYLKTIQDHKITLLHLVPPILLFMAKHPLVSNFKFAPFSYAVSGAAPLGADLTHAFSERLNCPLYQGYGLTETSPVISLDFEPGRVGTVGPLMANTLGKVVDPETGKTLPQGEVGEVCMKGPQMMRGYFENKEATDDMIRDGWLYTGDLGFFDADGFLTIEDRMKDLIKYKGSQVPPAELEDLLLSHPSIQDAAVLGVPDVEAGELPRAFVVVKPGTKLSQEEVAKFVEERVASYKRLRGGVEFLDAIPKSPSGKILRRVLKQQLTHDNS